MANSIQSLIFFVFLFSCIFILPTEVNTWQIQSRIVGGSSAVERQFPYHVSLRNKRNNLHFCGAAIINERNILTAAHCLIKMQESAVYGVVNLTHATDFGTRIEFSRWIIHPEFSEKTSRSDIALIQTNKPIIFSEFVNAVNLPMHKIKESGLVAIVSGWGISKAPKSTREMLFHAKRPSTLQYKVATIISYEKCQGEFMPLKKENFADWKDSTEALSEDTLCTGNVKGSGCCIGDSGGPLVFNNTLIGIVSWSVGCAKGLPDIYTNVRSQNKWIIDQM